MVRDIEAPKPRGFCSRCCHGVRFGARLDWSDKQAQGGEFISVAFG